MTVKIVPIDAFELVNRLETVLARLAIDVGELKELREALYLVAALRLAVQGGSDVALD